MQATDILDLYKYEDAIETAVKTLLSANEITASRQRDAATLATPRAEVQFTTGSGIEHYHNFPGANPRPDTFSGSLSVGIVTDRTKNDADHTTIRAKVRNLIYDFRDSINVLLSYHAILRVLESGTSPLVTAEDNQDVSTVNFTVDFCIRTDAWPQVV